METTGLLVIGQPQIKNYNSIEEFVDALNNYSDIMYSNSNGGFMGWSTSYKVFEYISPRGLHKGYIEEKHSAVGNISKEKFYDNKGNDITKYISYENSKYYYNPTINYSYIKYIIIGIIIAVIIGIIIWKHKH